MTATVVRRKAAGKLLQANHALSLGLLSGLHYFGSLQTLAQCAAFGKPRVLTGEPETELID